VPSVALERLTVWSGDCRSAGLANPLVSDERWAVVEPILPPVRPPGTRGHPPVPHRVALAGSSVVRKTGLPWESLPRERGGWGMTLWRRLRDWQQAGVWEPLHHRRLSRLADAGRSDGSRASADASRVPAQGGRRNGAEPDRSGPAGQPAPADHRTTWCPLVRFSTAAKVTEGTLLERLVDASPPRRQPHHRPGRPRPILPRIARRLIASSARVGRYRWVAERTLAWWHRHRRWLVRDERDQALHHAFLSLAAALVCWQVLRPPS
jgi:transposase